MTKLRESIAGSPRLAVKYEALNLLERGYLLGSMSRVDTDMENKLIIYNVEDNTMMLTGIFNADQLASYSKVLEFFRKDNNLDDVPF